MRGGREMIGGIISFRKSNEYSVERRVGDYGSGRKNRNAVKYRSTVPYPKILGPEMFEIHIFVFLILEMEYAAYIVYYVTYIVYYVTYIVYYVTYIVYYVTYIVYYVTYIVYYVTYIVYYVTYIVYYVTSPADSGSGTP
jgi:hypothetical protein